MSKFVVNLQASVEVEGETPADAVASAQGLLPEGAVFQSMQIFPVQEQHS